MTFRISKSKREICCLNCTCIKSLFRLGLQLKDMRMFSELSCFCWKANYLPVTDILKPMGIFTTFTCGSEWEYKSICNFVTCIPCLLSETEGYLRKFVLWQMLEVWYLYLSKFVQALILLKVASLFHVRHLNHHLFISLLTCKGLSFYMRSCQNSHLIMQAFK